MVIVNNCFLGTYIHWDIDIVYINSECCPPLFGNYEIWMSCFKDSSNQKCRRLATNKNQFNSDHMYFRFPRERSGLLLRMTAFEIELNRSNGSSTRLLLIPGLKRS
jgi:hypothetical protein